MIGESQLDFETKYIQGESIPVSTDKTITQIASDAYVQGFIAGRLKPPTEIEIDAALRYLNNNALIRQDITHITVKKRARRHVPGNEIRLDEKNHQLKGNTKR